MRTKDVNEESSKRSNQSRGAKKKKQSRDKVLEAVDGGDEKRGQICTDNLRAVTAPRSSVRLNRPELSPMAR